MCSVLYVIKKGEIVHLRLRQSEYDYVVGQKGLVTLENSKKRVNSLLDWVENIFNVSSLN